MPLTFIKFSDERNLLGIPWLASILLFSGSMLSAQVCPQGNIDTARLVDQMQHTDNSPNVLLRAAAIGGNSVAPALLHITRPGMPVDSVPGVAQVSLARLGNKAALGQLKEELNDTKSSSKAVAKLVRVGTDEAVSILMVYLHAHLHDNSLHQDFGDYIFDIRGEVIESLSKQLHIGPMMPNGAFSVSLQDWMRWWDQHKGKTIALSINERFRDPYLQCLARKVEWGFPDAVFDMVRTREPQVIPVLKFLARFGDQQRRFFNVATLQGRARLGLAQLGDPEELQTVKKELDLPAYGGAIEELRQLGGPVAVAALMNAFDSAGFLSQYKGTRGYEKEVVTRHQEIANALTKMVISPPETKTTPESKKKWKDWWAKNKDTAQFVKRPITTYE